jgi:hypothetical protein
VWSKSRSRAPSAYLTIKFSIAATAMESRAGHGTRAAYARYRRKLCGVSLWTGALWRGS